MKYHYSIHILVLVFLFSSFKVDKACEYAGSNINFVKTQTEKAIAVDNINQARYFAYKALNAIEKTKNQLMECGCEYATENITEGLSNLKLAIKATSLNSTRILLSRALENTIGSLESLAEHELHDSKYGSNLLAMNTVVTKKEKISRKKPAKADLERTIDLSLEKYKVSLTKIVDSVDCKEARAFAENIYLHCEQQLLLPNLSEGKKYYNLRTKDITADALERLNGCK
jgi:hypothetical protein